MQVEDIETSDVMVSELSRRDGFKYEGDLYIKITDPKCEDHLAFNVKMLGVKKFEFSTLVIPAKFTIKV